MFRIVASPESQFEARYGKVQFKMVSMRSEKMHFTPSLRLFPNDTFETVPVFV